MQAVSIRNPTIFYFGLVKEPQRIKCADTLSHTYYYAMELSMPIFTFSLIIRKEITSNIVQCNAYLIGNP